MLYFKYRESWNDNYSYFRTDMEVNGFNQVFFYNSKYTKFCVDKKIVEEAIENDIYSCEFRGTKIIQVTEDDYHKNNDTILKLAEFEKKRSKDALSVTNEYFNNCLNFLEENYKKCTLEIDNRNITGYLVKNIFDKTYLYTFIADDQWCHEMYGLEGYMKDKSTREHLHETLGYLSDGSLKIISEEEYLMEKVQ